MSPYMYMCVYTYTYMYEYTIFTMNIQCLYRRPVFDKDAIVITTFCYILQCKQPLLGCCRSTLYSVTRRRTASKSDRKSDYTVRIDLTCLTSPDLPDPEPDSGEAYPLTPRQGVLFCDRSPGGARNCVTNGKRVNRDNQRLI